MQNSEQHKQTKYNKSHTQNLYTPHHAAQKAIPSKQQQQQQQQEQEQEQINEIMQINLLKQLSRKDLDLLKSMYEPNANLHMQYEYNQIKSIFTSLGAEIKDNGSSHVSVKFQHFIFPITNAELPMPHTIARQHGKQHNDKTLPKGYIINFLDFLQKAQGINKEVVESVWNSSQNKRNNSATY